MLLFGSLSKGLVEHSSKKLINIDLLIIFTDNQLPVNYRERNNLKIELLKEIRKKKRFKY